MKYARISSDNLVIEIFVPPAGVSIAECFTAEVAVQFVEVPDNVEQNWTKQSNGTFIAPPLPSGIDPAPIKPE